MLNVLKLYYVVFNKEPSSSFKIRMARKYIESFSHLRMRQFDGSIGYRRLSFLVDIQLIGSLSEKDRRWIDAESICYVMHEIRFSLAYKANVISSVNNSVLLLEGLQSPFNESFEYHFILTGFERRT